MEDHKAHGHGSGFCGFGCRNEMHREDDPAGLIPEGLVEGRVVADLGCGTGHYSGYLAQYAAKLYAVDIDRGRLDIARERIPGKNVEFINASVSKTGIPAGSVDLVLMANVFHDIRTDEAVMEVERILKNDGTLLIIDWRKEEMGSGPPYELRMDVEDYRECFKGFQVVHSEKVGEYHYRIVMRKG